MTWTRRFISRTSNARSALLICGICLFLGASVDSVTAQDQEFKLNQSDEWKNIDEIVPGSESSQLLLARRALIEGNATRARDLATAFIDRYPNSMLQANAYLIRGDAYMADGDEYKALFDYEAIARN